MFLSFLIIIIVIVIVIFFPFFFTLFHLLLLSSFTYARFHFALYVSFKIRSKNLTKCPETHYKKKGVCRPRDVSAEAKNASREVIPMHK